MEGDKAAQVDVHVIAVANLLEGPDHGKADTIQKNRRAHGGASGKQCAPDFIAQHDHGSALRVIQVVEQAAFIDGQVADLVEIGGNTQDLAASLVEITDRANVVARNDGSRRPHAGAPTEDVFVIVVGQ